MEQSTYVSHQIPSGGWWSTQHARCGAKCRAQILSWYKASQRVSHNEHAQLHAALDQLDATDAQGTPDLERTQAVKDEEAARRWLEEFDAIAAEIDAAWQGDMSAADAVKEQRREL